MQMLITLEPLGLLCSNFVYLCILTLFSQWYGDEDSSNIILAGLAILFIRPSVHLQLSKTLITLEPLGLVL